jgi:hypothetical protein
MKIEFLIPEDKQYAFWKYDIFPYCLGGKVIELSDDGIAAIEGYGGYRVIPFLFTTLEKGLEIKKNLDHLKETRKMILKTINKGFDLQIKTFIQIPGLHYDK